MTVADLSVILAKVQVDETDVVRLKTRDSVEVNIDAYPDTTFSGRVTKVSHSAKLTATQTASGSNDRAVDFDVEITLKKPPPDIRPDLSCTARIVTDTRNNALSIPIIALTVRDHEKIPNEVRRAAPPVDTLRARFPKREAEGVFVVRDGAGHLPAGQGRRGGRRVLRGGGRTARGRDHRGRHLPGYPGPEGWRQGAARPTPPRPGKRNRPDAPAGSGPDGPPAPSGHRS